MLLIARIQAKHTSTESAMITYMANHPLPIGTVFEIKKDKIVSLGDGKKPAWFTEYCDNPDRERDPAAIAQIEAENGFSL